MITIQEQEMVAQIVKLMRTILVFKFLIKWKTNQINFNVTEYLIVQIVYKI